MGAECPLLLAERRREVKKKVISTSQHSKIYIYIFMVIVYFYNVQVVHQAELPLLLAEPRRKVKKKKE